jgi:Cupin domain
MNHETKQSFTVSHLKDAVFEPGLRAYAHYRDLGIALATSGAAVASVIRLIPPCDPKEVSIPHRHGVEFQMVYLLKGWLVSEFEGEGAVRMEVGSCWLQPNGIRHAVLDYSDDCELLEIVMPANFSTENLG